MWLLTVQALPLFRKYQEEKNTLKTPQGSNQQYLQYAKLWNNYPVSSTNKLQEIKEGSWCGWGWMLADEAAPHSLIYDPLKLRGGLSWRAREPLQWERAQQRERAVKENGKWGKMGSRKRAHVKYNIFVRWHCIRMRKKESTNMDESHTHCVKKKKLDIKEYLLYNCICKKFWKNPN